MGFSLRRMFKNPFGRKSIFGRAISIASVLPIPGAGLLGKAWSLANRAKRSYDTLAGRVNPILTAAGARPLVPSQAPEGVMPGGTRTARAARSTQRRSEADPRRRGGKAPYARFDITRRRPGIMKRKRKRRRR